MNKRYIDFVPAKRKPTGNGSAPRVNVARPHKAEKAWADEADYIEEVPISQMFAEKAPPVGVSTGLPPHRKETVEDHRPKFVKTEVKKRPLSMKKPSLTAPKSVRKPVQGAGFSQGVGRSAQGTRFSQGVGRPAQGVGRPAQNSANASRAALGRNNANVAVSKKAPQGMAKLRPTQAKFLNTNKIVKRPLSQNTHVSSPQMVPGAGGAGQRVARVPAKSSKKSEKPTVIIAKPEKDSKAGLIVAIIITIILGAAAGTVAFLLLPK